MNLFKRLSKTLSGPGNEARRIVASAVAKGEAKAKPLNDLLACVTWASFEIEQ